MTNQASIKFPDSLIVETSSDAADSPPSSSEDHDWPPARHNYNQSSSGLFKLPIEVKYMIFDYLNASYRRSSSSLSRNRITRRSEAKWISVNICTEQKIKVTICPIELARVDSQSRSEVLAYCNRRASFRLYSPGPTARKMTDWLMDNTRYFTAIFKQLKINYERNVIVKKPELGTVEVVRVDFEIQLVLGHPPRVYPVDLHKTQSGSNGETKVACRFMDNPLLCATSLREAGIEGLKAAGIHRISRFTAEMMLTLLAAIDEDHKVHSEDGKEVWHIL